MIPPSGLLIKCACCREDVAENEAVMDKDLSALVDKECFTRLRWAEAYLKGANVRGCMTAPDIEIRPLIL